MFEADVQDVTQLVSTGALPSPGEIDSLLGEAFARYRDARDGEVADYIPILGAADPDLFGISLVTADGRGHALGASAHAFSIQSISKAFVYALVCDALGHEVVHERVGVNNTGLPFNSVVALELNAGSPMNPMVNAGAIATTGLVDADAAAAWEKIQSGLSAFAGRDLLLDDEVFRSEMVTNQRNRAIAHLLSSYGRLDQEALGVVSTYTKQCALSVTTADLAVMGATLADGGVNPVTGDRVVSAQAARDTLSVLASCGMYERSGEWLFEIGLPAKSGVSGGILAVSPGKGALAVYSPPLDAAGNSVRGQRVCAFLSRALGLNLFASTPRVAAARAAASPAASRKEL